MTRVTIAGGAFAIVLTLFALAVGYRALEQAIEPAAATSSVITPSVITPSTPTPPSAPALEGENHEAFLYGRITTHGGTTYEGRLRWGDDEEAFWGDYFNGFKDANPWGTHVPNERLPKERRSIELFGLEIARQERQLHLNRPFLARFGDIGHIEARGRQVRVTLKSGTAFDLDRHSASDFDDGVRVWDAVRGVVDLGARRIRSVELLPSAQPGAVPARLYGTVRSRQGNFTGFVQWDRNECVGPDKLDGRTADGELSVRFDTIRSISRHSRGSSLVTLHDGREIILSDTREAGRDNLGVYVDDLRYGRVLISWKAFERIDFSPAGGSGPAYGDFPPGHPLTGSVTTRAGRRLTGRLVYDLDESETTETLDAPSQGVYYTIPFGLIASIVLPGREELAKVILHGGEEIEPPLEGRGEELELERLGDLGKGNAGMLIFIDGRQQPEYLSWKDVKQIDFDRPPAAQRSG